MKHTVKNVFIAGGTGFLGYYSALQFLKKRSECKHHCFGRKH